MNLLLFNLAMDADDTILAFTTTWVNRLAQHYAAVDVVTMRAGRLDTAPNVRVYSVGKERGYSEARRAAEFYRLLRRLLNQRRYDVCFAHMMPLFAVMGAPLLLPLRVPITVWYNHRSRYWAARYAMPVSRRIVTSAADSFPFPTSKIRVVGQGVDTDFFKPSGDRSGTQVVYVARLSPIKQHPTLLRALAAIPDAGLVIIGGRPAGDDSTYEDALHLQVDALGLRDRVTFAGGQLPEGVRDAYATAAASVNLSPLGLFDKTAFEAMACGVPTIISNPAFAPVLGTDAPRLLIPSETDHAALADRLGALLALPAAERVAIGARLRDSVIRSNSLDVLIPRLVSVINTGELPDVTAP